MQRRGLRFLCDYFIIETLRLRRFLYRKRPVNRVMRWQDFPLLGVKAI